MAQNLEVPMVAERFPVEASHIMMFARSIGDPNPVYYDADYAQTSEPGRIIAPPTFAQASAQFDEDYPLRPKIGEPWFGSGATATGIAPKPATNDGDGEKSSGGGGNGGGLHAEQHFTYHRHVGPGDVLSLTVKPGKTWEKQSRRGGKLVFSESVTEFHNQDGELMITSRGVGVKTEKPIERGES
jgi:hypothetical protein